MQLFSYTGNPGNKVTSEQYAYTIYCTDNHFVCIFLVLLRSIRSSVCVDQISCLLNMGDLKIGQELEQLTCFSGSLIACLLGNFVQVPHVKIKTIIY